MALRNPFAGIDPETEARKAADILRRPRYLALSLIVAVAAFTAYALLLNYGLLMTLLSAGRTGLVLDLVPGLVWGYVMTTTNTALVLSTLTAAFVGINVGLVVFRLVELRSFGREGASSLGGMALAVVAPACPACATAIFAVAGLSSAFAVLPFKGTEIKVLAVLMLAGSALWITSQINKQVCEFC